MKEYNVAIVGATGLVGKEFIKILYQRKFPIKSLHLLASDRSAGRQVEVNGNILEVKDTAGFDFAGIDFALFSAGADVSLIYSPIAAKAGAVVIDNSSAFRMDPDAPLVVPEINPGDIKAHKGIIANPNCSTIQMVMALNPLHKVNPIKRIIVDTYQSVSGTGSAAIDELLQQTRDILAGRETAPQVYPHQIGFNVLPEIDAFLDNDYTKEEWKMVQETHKIMHAPEIAISATCARVPVFFGHSEAVHAEFSTPMAPDFARKVLSEAPGVKVIDETSSHGYPYAVMAEGKDEVFVGRIRQDASHPNGLAMWIVSDNIRKGAALNAVQIAEVMAREGMV